MVFSFFKKKRNIFYSNELLFLTLDISLSVGVVSYSFNDLIPDLSFPSLFDPFTSSFPRHGGSLQVRYTNTHTRTHIRSLLVRVKFPRGICITCPL